LIRIKWQCNYYDKLIYFEKVSYISKIVTKNFSKYKKEQGKL